MACLKLILPPNNETVTFRRLRVKAFELVDNNFSRLSPFSVHINTVQDIEIYIKIFYASSANKFEFGANSVLGDLGEK